MQVILFDGENECFFDTHQIENEMSLDRIAALFQTTAIYLDSAKDVLNFPHPLEVAVRILKAETGLQVLAKKLEEVLGIDMAMYFIADTNLLINLERNSYETIQCN